MQINVLFLLLNVRDLFKVQKLVEKIMISSHHEFISSILPSSDGKVLFAG